MFGAHENPKIDMCHAQLLGGLEHFLFFIIYGIIIIILPIDELIFFRGFETTNQSQVGVD